MNPDGTYKAQFEGGPLAGETRMCSVYQEYLEDETYRHVAWSDDDRTARTVLAIYEYQEKK